MESVSTNPFTPERPIMRPRFLLAPPGGPIRSLFWLAGLLLGVTLVWAQDPAPLNWNARLDSPAATESRPATRRPTLWFREGTEIVNTIGHFRITGDRVTFFTADGSGRYVALENLSLERITRTIANSPASLQWSVTGTLTEYRGANFLIVKHAILKSRLSLPEDRSP